MDTNISSIAISQRAADGDSHSSYQEKGVPRCRTATLLPPEWKCSDNAECLFFEQYPEKHISKFHNWIGNHGKRCAVNSTLYFFIKQTYSLKYLIPIQVMGKIKNSDTFPACLPGSYHY